MAVLLPTETRSVKGRLIHGGIIALLLLGGVTMVYPFLVMLSGSVRSAIDEAELDLIPDFLVNDEALYRKFLEFKYNGDINALNRAHRTTYFSFQEIEPPDAPPARGTRALDAPFFHRALGGMQANKAVPANLRRWRERLSDRFAGDLDAFVEAGGTPAASWLVVVMAPPRWFDRRYDPPYGPEFDAYLSLGADRPSLEHQPVSLAGHFLQTMVFPTYGRDAAALSAFSRDIGEPLRTWSDFNLATRAPGEDQHAYRQLWLDYIDREVSPSFLVVDPELEQAYRNDVSNEYVQISSLNVAWTTTFGGFGEVRLPDGSRWLQGQEKLSYLRFLSRLPPDRVTLIDPAADWRDIAAQEWEGLHPSAGAYRRQFAFRNYINVWDELAGEGRALWNTVIYCTLSIVLALLVNPLAAYGLSRFRLRGGYKALLVLMATMAFPPMVTLIPQFIVLRNLGLMNTFVALLLPLIANGYLIFLLKGFFDSLPQELYEAGTIDGASELRMFFQIAMALSKPILAVVALQTFTAAYTMFLYALLVAPDRDMWLISVWLFQYQERASSSGVFASVVIASVPTLLLFLLVQRTIMRGIVVPTEK